MAKLVLPPLTSDDPTITTRHLEFMAAAVGQAMLATRPFMVGAVLAAGARHLSAGHNSKRNNPEFVDAGWSQHAEMAVLRHPSTDGATIYVARVIRPHPGIDDYGYSWMYAMARPCKACHTELLVRGVKKAFYTDVDGSVRKIAISELTMPEDRTSRWKATRTPTPKKVSV